MSDEITTEIASLQAQIEAILTEDTYAERRHRAAEGNPRPQGWRLRTSPRTKDLELRVVHLRRQMAVAAIDAEYRSLADADFVPARQPAAPAALLPPVPPFVQPAFARSHEQQAEALAAEIVAAASARPTTSPHADPAVEALAAEIIASFELAGGGDAAAGSGWEGGQ